MTLCFYDTFSPASVYASYTHYEVWLVVFGMLHEKVNWEKGYLSENYASVIVSLTNCFPKCILKTPLNQAIRNSYTEQ